MNVSGFGRKVAARSGIGQLMEDLGAALCCKDQVFMLGGKPEKREYCQHHGIEYIVLKRLPKPESTRLRGF